MESTNSDDTSSNTLIIQIMIHFQIIINYLRLRFYSSTNLGWLCSLHVFWPDCTYSYNCLIPISPAGNILVFRDDRLNPIHTRTALFVKL